MCEVVYAYRIFLWKRRQQRKYDSSYGPSKEKGKSKFENEKSRKLCNVSFVAHDTI